MRALLGAVLLLGISIPCGGARADAVGPLDPTAARICGGSVHNPACPPELLSGACCALVALVLGGGGLVAMSRRASSSRDPR